MKAAQRVVKEMQRMLSLGVESQDAGAAELAAEYADLCRDANERLRRCRRHIDEGMVREAMHIAEARPPLLELCAVLDIAGVDRWTQMTKSGGWAIAESIDASTISLINETYGSASSLEPTVKAYSGAAQRKEYGTCVRLLRRLLILAPDSQIWAEDLRAFESKRLDEIEKEQRDADASDDLDTLEALAAELNEKWVSDTSAAVKDRLASALQRVREKAASERGMQIAERISDSYAAFDYAPLENAIKEYDRLLADGYFKPTVSLCAQYEEAREWYVGEKDKREQEAEFQQNLENLQAELVKDVPSKEVEPLFRLLQAAQGKVPEDVRVRAVRMIESYQVMEYRRKRLLVALSSVAALLMAVLMSAYFGYRHYQSLIAFYTPRLQHAIRQLAPDALAAINSEIEAHVFFGSLVHKAPEIQELLLKKADVTLEAGKKEDRFRDVLERLNAIRNNAFIDDIECRTLIAEAKALIQSVDALRADPHATESVNALIAARTSHWQNVLGEKADALQKLTRQTMDRLPPFEAPVAGNLDAIDATLTACAGQIKAGEDLVREIMRIALETEVKGFTDLTIQNFRSAEVEIAARRKSISQRRELLAKAGSARNLGGYVQALQDYAREFPDDTRSGAFTSIVERSSHYECLLAFSVDGASMLSATALERFSDGIPPENYFWDTLLQQHATLIKNLDMKWPRIRENLESWKNDKLLAALCTFEYKDQQRGQIFDVFCFDDFQKKVSGTPLRQYYRGEVYVPKAEDERAQFREPKDGISNECMNNFRRLAHCEYATSMVQKVGTVRQANADVFLLNEIAALASNDKFLNPLLKLRLTRFYGQQIVELVGAGALPEMDAAQAAMDAADDGTLEWLCTKSPLVQAACQTAASILATHFADVGFIDKYRVERSIRERCVQRSVKWVGFVDFENPSRIHLQDTSVKEVWVLRPASSEMQIMVAAEAVQGAFRIGETLLPAEPLFAPASTESRTTREMARQLVTETGLRGPALNSINWPRVWPANRRE